MAQQFTEVPDSNTVYKDTTFVKDNQHVASTWVRIGELYPDGAKQPLIPETLSRDQFAQGQHYECFMLSALSTLVRFPGIIRNCFISEFPRKDGRYTFQFFRGKEWVKVEIDDTIALDADEVLYCRSPSEHWWPLLLEKAYAKFYTSYENLEGCTLQETFYDLTGNPVLNIPMEVKLAKAAGAEINEGHYWLDLAQKIQKGQFVASALTKNMDVENLGLQREQPYGILDIFSLTGTSALSDVVIHMHNPFEDEEFQYKGPLNSQDSQWTPQLRSKHKVDDTHSIFLPLTTFLKIVGSMQLAYVTNIEPVATYFTDEWKGETAGGNPTQVTWRKNPLYYVRNAGNQPVALAVVIKQEDQRHTTSPDEETTYVQCGMVLVQCSIANPIPTLFTTGNNHKPVHKSLFLNSREVANAMTIPPNSLCYLVPSCMEKGKEAHFTLAMYRMKDQDYSTVTIKKLAVPEMDWAHPAIDQRELAHKEKRRVDFYVEQGTNIHILMHQLKAFVSKTGGNAMTEDYIGMYLYDDTDRKIGGVHAATNFRETSIIMNLPRSGRYAINITCPRAKEAVPVEVTVVGSSPAKVRIVDPPDDAAELIDFDEDKIDEGDAAAAAENPIDFEPYSMKKPRILEVDDDGLPYEDKRFFIENRDVTDDPWLHITDIYPEGKTQPLLPEKLELNQFEQGHHYECGSIAAFATLLEHHPDVLRDAFVSKKVRKDGRYTFRFYRYGEWVKVEIDDRIPVVANDTLFCRSPTRHWWPLLLEKAYAKFYTTYSNLERCSLQEILHDFTGKPVITIPTDVKLAKAAMHNVDEPQFWVSLEKNRTGTALAGLTKMGEAEQYGMQEDQTYAILGIVSLTDSANPDMRDLLVKLYNPFVEMSYVGPMNKDDAKWTSELRRKLTPERRELIYMPVTDFCTVFLNVQEAHINDLVDPSWHLNSEWGENTNGGNVTLLTWRENPLYVVRNTSDDPLQMVVMVEQPDQRHTLHLHPDQDLQYIQCGMVLAQGTAMKPIPTYLVTWNNHRTVYKGLYSNSREVANVVTVPSNSLCYLVPSAMYRDMGKFLLSFWYINKGDSSVLRVERLNAGVARDLPAIKHLELHNMEKGRVDFLVDVPTSIHILLSQEKPFKPNTGVDTTGEDFLGMYLYDDKNRRINGVVAATNYREIGIVHHLPQPGRYALSVTCPRGNGTVPCRVEVVGVEPSHVRITDAPEGAGLLDEVDLGFLDTVPEGVPLEDLPLDNDPVFQSKLDELKELMEKGDTNTPAIQQCQKQLNDRAHQLAKQILGKDRPKYLPGRDLAMLNPHLDASPEYMKLERERYNLRKDPRNATKVRGVEGELQALADQIAEDASGGDLAFLGEEVEGIPVADIPLMDDPEFAAMAKERALLKRNPTANASKIDDIEQRLAERAQDIANDMHNKERGFLDPEPEGIPLDLLPLNEDPAFSEMEDALRALNRKPRKDARAIQDLQNKLNERAHELAADLKQSERDIFLDPTPNGVPAAELPLDTDEPFHTAEIARLRLRKSDPRGKQDAIRALEEQLNARAEELAKDRVVKDRAFLEPEPMGFRLEDLGLDYQDEFTAEEKQLRALKKDPRKNATAIKASEEKLQAMVNAMAAEEASRDRKFLDPEPQGRFVRDLPLHSDPAFTAMDKQRRVALRNPNADPAAITAMEDALNGRAHEIAHALNKAERPQFMRPFPRGIVLEDLPLDDDKPFRELEIRRQRLKRDPQRNAEALATVEDQMNARAEELAGDIVKGDRAFLDPEPAGIPIQFVPIDQDPEFRELEAKRAALKNGGSRNPQAIRALEDELNRRAEELAQDLKEKERQSFLDPAPLGVPAAYLPLDTDKPFRAMEAQRIALREQPAKNASNITDVENALNDRAIELAKQVQAQDRAFLDPEPLGIPIAELPLDKNKEFVAKEAQLRELKKDPRKNASAIKALEDDLHALELQVAAEEAAKSRAFLDPEPEGRLLEELPLNTDPTFLSLEKKRRDLKKNPSADPKALSALEQQMEDRTHELAKQMNAAERPKYLDAAPRGVPLQNLPLDTDEKFAALEAARARRQRDPSKKTPTVADLEEALRERANDLASAALKADRDYLDAEPAGVPLSYVPIDEDPAFRDLEAQRAALKSDPRRNAAAIKEVEARLNERAAELADEIKEKEREHVLDPAPLGVPLEFLRLSEDPKFTAIEVEHIKALAENAPEAEVAALEEAMNKRAEELAAQRAADDRAFLDPEPLGIPVSELPLDSHPEFVAKEAQLRELKKDPRKNASAIKALEDELRDIQMQIAAEEAAKGRAQLNPESEGRLLEELPLNTDPTFLALEKKQRALKRTPNVQQCDLDDGVQQLNDRMRQLAKQMNASERPSFLEPTHRGVPYEKLPLNTDETFSALEAARARRQRDASKKVPTVADLEDELRARADDLAGEVLKNDRNYLEPEPAGVPLKYVPINEDPIFAQLEAERARLAHQDPQRNARAIRDVEDKLNDRVRALAEEVKQRGRQYLDQRPLGVPLSDLALDTDEPFHALEAQWREVEHDPSRAGEAEGALGAMDARAHELAAALHEAERAPLDQQPLGVPLSALPLNEDPEFIALESEARQLKKTPHANARKIADVEAKLNDRATELAKQSRLAYCDAEPEGIPLELLRLEANPEFLQLEAERREALARGEAGAADVAALEAELNEAAHAAAKNAISGDRPQYLDAEPEGVPLEDLPLDTDSAYHALEVERAKLQLKDPRWNARAIKALEAKLNDRAHELARDVLAKDLEGIEEAPRGIPVALLKPHENREFASMARDLRGLRKDPQATEEVVAAKQRDLQAQVERMAHDRLAGDRAYLDPKPEGVPIAILPLETDPEFQKLEAERARLKALDPVRYAAKVKDAEAKLNDRAHELAKEQLAEDLRGLDSKPEDIPLELLKPHDDADFYQGVQALRELKKNPTQNAANIAAVQAQLNDRAHELAHEAMAGDRGYLDPEPEGVPLAVLPLDTDPAFHAMEAERATLKLKDPRRNAAKIKDLERQLNDRAHELAKEQLEEDLAGVHPEPRGIPVMLLKPHDDPQIAAIVPRLREMKKHPEANAANIAAAQAQLNERAHELAHEAMAGDRGYLDVEPQGVPLAVLPLDTDPTFHAMEAERATLKLKDPRRNAAKIKELERQLNDRAHEVAREQLADDLNGIDPAPRDIPLELLKPHEDAEIGPMIAQLRQLKASPEGNSAAIGEVLEEINARVDALAEAVLAGDRGYLDPEPEGVPIRVLPLDFDPTFHAMEVERAKLKLKDPRRNAAKIKELERQLNDRAHELAKEQLSEDLSGIDPAPEGIPLELLKPHDDPQVAAMVPNLRELKLDPGANADEIRAVENEMNNRAYELADAALDGDREYLDPQPLGVPLEELPLKSDPAFSRMEVERAILKLKDPRRNAAKVKELEDELNERAKTLAQAQLDEDLEGFAKEYDGMATALLHPHNDTEFAAMVPELRRAKREANRDPEALDSVTEAMDRRLQELAKEKLEGDLWFLDKQPEDVAVELLPLSNNEEFEELRRERANLKAEDARANADKIEALEARMNEIAHEVAKQYQVEDLRGIDKEPEDVPLEMLKVREDPTMAKMIAEHRHLREDPAKNADKLRALEAEMNERAHEIAKEVLAGDREKYVDVNPEGVPSSILPLDSDPMFHAMEVERAKLKLSDPEKNAAAIESLEERLNERAHELAVKQLEEDLEGVETQPRGVPVALLHPHDDPEFVALVNAVRAQKLDPAKNASAVKVTQQDMSQRLQELADELLATERAEYLDPAPEGVSFDALPLDTDPEFHALEVERMQLKAKDPKRNADRIADLGEKLNERAHELAKKQLAEDLRGLDPEPQGVPVTLLRPHEDAEFAALVPVLRELKKDPARNAAKLKEVEAKLNDRLDDLAAAFNAEQREQYLAPMPKGIPYTDLPLDADPTFRALESERSKLLLNPEKNAPALHDVEEKLNQRAEEIAREELTKDRAYLDPMPEGVPLRALPLDTDPAFSAMEVERARLNKKDPKRNALKIEDLEKRLNDRAHELAKEQLAEDLRGLDPEPEGIPLEILKPHEDPTFADMVESLRELKKDPKKNAAKIAEVAADMNDRAHELAKAAIAGDRQKHTDAEPEGVPVNFLPLDTDPAYHQLEVERAKLKLADPQRNAAAIASLEEQLNDRAHELAKEQLARELDGVEVAPYGIPLELLKPHEDQVVRETVAAVRSAPDTKSRSLNAVPDPDVKERLNARVMEMAKAALANDREKYLDRDPEGVPFFMLPLDTDPEFHEMEVERYVLKAKDPVRNADRIADLEARLNDRAHELAQEIVKGDRASYLDPTPDGVPLSVLPLDTDPTFHAMEVERARLKAKSATANAKKIAELEDQLNDRAHELAKAQLAEDLRGLDSEPEGIPIALLKPHDDAEFASIVPELRAAKKNPTANAAKLKDAQARLNDRAHELAKEKIARDRAEYLDPEPEGIPVGILPLDADKAFHTMEMELRKHQAAARPNEAAIAKLKEQLNDRAHELAKEKIQGDRGYLDPEPEGVPLEDVPLEGDAAFTQMEAERAKLKEDPKRNAAKIKELEDQLNDRAHQLAKAMKAADRAFLEPKPHGIPLALVPLDDDRAFAKMEQQLRKLKKDGRRNAPAVAELQDKMQERVNDMALQMLRGERDAYLDAEPEGVPLADVPIDGDAVFGEAELQRAVLKAQDPKANANAISELESKLNERAHELARERIAADRAFLDKEMEGIPLADLPLDADPEFKRMEQYLRQLKRDPRRNAPLIADLQNKMQDTARELAHKQAEEDLKCLKDSYRGIPTTDLKLHDDDEFRALANRRRRERKKGTAAPDMAMIEDEMDRRASEIADDVIAAERAFLDREPEGMLLQDVPLDEDDTFAKLEADRRRRMRDPRAANKNKDVIRDLEEKMNDRAHELAKEEFAKMRGFMDQAPEGIPLSELRLDADPQFKDAEIAHYRLKKDPSADAATVATMEAAMNDRAHELAKAQLAKDRGFLDPEPEGVPLKYLPLDTDPKFNELARERRKLKKDTSRRGKGADAVREVEAKMNDRAHELAKAFLAKERGFLDAEPQGVPIADVPLHTDALFREMERERLVLKEAPENNAEKIAQLEAQMKERSHDNARELLRKERAFLEPEPRGVPLEELPLNSDEVLNPIERKRRELRRDPKRNADEVRAHEQLMAQRVDEIAAEAVEKSRAFLDQEPEGVPLALVPLDDDRTFRDMEKELRKLKKQPAKNKDKIAQLEANMNERAHDVAADLLRKERAFLDQEPEGVPLEDVPVGSDPAFHEMELKRLSLKSEDPARNAPAIKDLEKKMNDRAHDIAADLLRKERAFLDQVPEGIALTELPLDKDKAFREKERELRKLRKEPKKNAEKIKDAEADLNDRAHELARRRLADDRYFLDPEPEGVLLEDLPLDSDPVFRGMELERLALKKDPKKNADAIKDLEGRLNDRAHELAKDCLTKERAFLDQDPEGIPLERLPLDSDKLFHTMELDRRKLRKDPKRNAALIKELEDRMNTRAHELAVDARGWQDVEFHEQNKDVAEEWPRICELYPEGLEVAPVPEAMDLSDVSSAPQDAGYLAPFIAALARHPTLIQRLVESKSHPVNGPYSFILFDPNSNPVRVEVDDRVPCDAEFNPKFTQVPNRAWYPLLLEKAYAKFVGGYRKLDQCTPHETLRDLTGRPVLHIPFDDKLAEAANIGDYRSVAFWRGVAADLNRGDVITAMSSPEAPHGIHPQCSYALLGVIFTLEDSKDPSDVVVKVHNSYFDAPNYTGPLNANDPNWTEVLREVCHFDPNHQEFLYLPLPIFLQNFSSMQRCHINCGDRLTSPGEWDKHSAGGNPKYTSFRTNPIYLLENKSSRPATVLTELRHGEASYADPDGVLHYHQTGLVLMQPIMSSLPPTPLITNGTHRFIQKGMMLDAREVCAQMVLPPSSVCYLIPYTMKRGSFGKFNVSVYPGMAKVTLTPLRNGSLTSNPLTEDVVLKSGGVESRRLDFTVEEACDVHVLVRQNKVSDASTLKKGDVIAEDDVTMTVFNESGIRITSTGDASNAREHAVVFRAPQVGRYALQLSCPGSGGTGDCPLTVAIYTPKKVVAAFAEVPANARSLVSRFPTIPRTAPSASRGGSRASSVRRTTESQPGRGGAPPSRGFNGQARK